MLAMIWKVIIKSINSMENKKIIIAVVIILFVSLSFLIYRSNHLKVPQWWVVYFSNAKDSSLNFTIENNSAKTDFHWQVTADNNIVSQGDAQVGKEEIKNISIENINAKKVIVDVSSGSEKREIYKNL